MLRRDEPIEALRKHRAEAPVGHDGAWRTRGPGSRNTGQDRGRPGWRSSIARFFVLGVDVHFKLGVDPTPLVGTSLFILGANPYAFRLLHRPILEQARAWRERAPAWRERSGPAPSATAADA